MKITSSVALLLFLALIIAIFQVVQNRHAFPLRAAATPSVSVTPFLASAGTPIAAFTPLLIETPTLTPTLVVSYTPTLSPTIPATTPTFSPTPTAPYTPTQSPPFQSSIPTLTPLLGSTSRNCPLVTHHNAFTLPADKQNDIDWITTAIVEYLNGGGDPYRIVDTFRLLGWDALIKYVDLEGDGYKELLLEITILPPQERESYLGVLDCMNGQFGVPNWIAETKGTYSWMAIVDITDLDGDGVREILFTKRQSTNGSEYECQIEVMIYWESRHHLETLNAAFPPSDSCSSIVRVTDQKAVLVYNSDYKPSEVALYQWNSNSQIVQLIGIEPREAESPVWQKTTLPALPSPLAPNLQGSSHCPPIKAIEDFWLVPTLQQYTSSSRMILDFDDEEKGITPQILAYLNAGGDPHNLFLALARHDQASDFRKTDLNSDGVDEILIKIHSGSFEGTNQIGLFFCTRHGAYKFAQWLGSDEYGYRDIVTVEDFNRDGHIEVLMEEIPVMSACYKERHLLGWNGTQLTRYFIDAGGNECDTTLTVSDLDNDGYKEWIIWGNDDRFRWDWRRNATWVYKLKPITEIDPLLQQDRSYYEKLPDDGLVYVLEAKVLDAPTDRIHVLEDAFTAFENGDIKLAVVLYEQAITEFSFQPEIEDLSRQLQGDELSDAEREISQSWHDVLVEQEPYTLAFAHLRLIMLHVATGDISQADYWLNQMVARFPDETKGSGVRIAAQTFMQEWHTTHSISSACHVLEIQYQGAYQTLNSALWQSRFYIGLQHLCPFTE